MLTVGEEAACHIKQGRAHRGPQRVEKMVSAHLEMGGRAGTQRLGG